MFKKTVHIILLFWSFSSKADALDDLKKCMTTVYSMQDVSFKVNIKMYNTSTDKAPQMNITSNSIKKGKNFLSDFMGKTTIYNYKSKEIIEVNENNKTIVFSLIADEKKHDTIILPAKNNKPLFQIDTAAFTNGKYSYVENGPVSIVIEIRPAKVSQYSAIHITIDSKTFLFKKIEYFPKKQENTVYYERIVADYNFNTTGIISDDAFSLNKYISHKGNSVKLKPAYSTYKLVNQLKPNKK